MFVDIYQSWVELTFDNLLDIDSTEKNVCGILSLGLVLLVVVIMAIVLTWHAAYLGYRTCAYVHSRYCPLYEGYWQQNALVQQQGKAIEELKARLQEKDDLIKKYTNRLAAEMNHKVSADESNVENVSIRNRPMNIADDYESMCTDEWLQAKEALDEKIKHLADHVKVSVLFRILMTAYGKIDEFYKNYWRHLQMLYQTPTTLLTGHQHSKKDIDPQEANDDNFDLGDMDLPKSLVNAVCDYLRNCDEALELDQFVEEILENLGDFPVEVEAKKDNIAAKLHSLCKSEPDIQQYTKACLNFCWKMVIQRPQMTFQVKDKYLGDSFHNLHWNSVQPDTPHKLIHVYPLLYHGKNLMKKGKVLLIPSAAGKEDSETDDDL